jgi:antitoxin component YwqK of YwqJK toxin-antitoxin module
LYPSSQKKFERIKEKLIWRNSDGKEYLEYSDFNLYKEYHENGKLKRCCYTDQYGVNYMDTICKEYDANGDLVYEGKYRHK